MDLYKQLRVFEYDVKLYCIIFQLAKCLAFVSENIASTNAVSYRFYWCFQYFLSNSKHEQSSLIFLACQVNLVVSTGSLRNRQKMVENYSLMQKEPAVFDKTKVEATNCHKQGFLQESVEQKEDKTGGGMDGIREIQRWELKRKERRV
ncbi:hypothetical protein Tco_0331335 [Tanacetum coccineum]